jgi:hypothetical protein
MSDSHVGPLATRLLPDSEHARRFIELSSIAADWVTAVSALDHAERLRRENSDHDVADLLVDHAVVAYSRAFLPSKVRRTATQHVTIPDEHAGTHDAVLSYRNRRLAHSQSRLSSTFAYVSCDDDGVRPGILAMTIAQPLPTDLVRQWRRLIDDLLDLLDVEITAVEASLLDEVRAQPLSDIRSWPAWPVVDAKPAAEFTARDSRGRYPTSITLYKDSDDEPLLDVAATEVD